MGQDNYSLRGLRVKIEGATCFLIGQRTRDYFMLTEAILGMKETTLALDSLGNEPQSPLSNPRTGWHSASW